MQSETVSRVQWGWWGLLIALGVALGLRLVVWHWHTYYPLGGDEQEYLSQALTLLRDHRYEELRLMRPPLYGVFLAAAIVVVDSLVQQLRLVQALISVATVIPFYLLTTEIATAYDRWNWRPPKQLVAPLIAAGLAAASYTLADRATELLSETLFLFVLTTFLWLLVRIITTPRHRRLVAASAGVLLGILLLIRSVALPLLPLGVLWLAANAPPRRPLLMWARSQGRHVFFFAIATLIVILPWTARNTLQYGAPILIDTTGAENLWLDNDPNGREWVKQQLYALGDDRAARQELATERGIAAIFSHPDHFAAKAWGEIQHFFALEYTDDMRARPVIWVPPAEVWARLLLGDGLFILIVVVGLIGLWSTPVRAAAWQSSPAPRWSDPRWLFGLWALYLLATAALFHVELRYRLPLYPVLIPYTAIAIQRVVRGETHRRRSLRQWAIAIMVHPATIALCLMLLHAPYPLLAWNLGWKHVRLSQAAVAIEEHDPFVAEELVQAVLLHDPDSVVGRVTLAQVARMQGQTERAKMLLHDAIDLLPAHPLPHLLLGDILRQNGNLDAAREEFAYEVSSLQDLQMWSWRWFTTPPSSTVDVGNGLDLGIIRGFHLANGDNAHAAADWRWTKGKAYIRVAATGCTTLTLRLASGRPPEAPQPLVRVRADGVEEQFRIASEWHDYEVKLSPPPRASAPMEVQIRSDTFTPRDYDPTSDDGRTLGIKVDRLSCFPRHAP